MPLKESKPNSPTTPPRGSQQHSHIPQDGSQQDGWLQQDD